MLSLHRVYSHIQSTAGVFCIASRSVQQHLPDVVTREQTKVGTLLGYRRDHFSSSNFGPEQTIHAQILVTGIKCFCTEKDTLRYLSRGRTADDGHFCFVSVPSKAKGPSNEGD
jgi:hypothetical protein